MRTNVSASTPSNSYSARGSGAAATGGWPYPIPYHGPSPSTTASTARSTSRVCSASACVSRGRSFERGPQRAGLSSGELVSPRISQNAGSPGLALTDADPQAATRCQQPRRADIPNPTDGTAAPPRSLTAVHVQAVVAKAACIFALFVLGVVGARRVRRLDIVVRSVSVDRRGSRHCLTVTTGSNLLWAVP